MQVICLLLRRRFGMVRFGCHQALENKKEHYEDHMVNRANSIIKASETLYKNDEISYLEYVSNLETALNLNIHYWELINNCNRTMIEIYYTIY